MSQPTPNDYLGRTIAAVGVARGVSLTSTTGLPVFNGGMTNRGILLMFVVVDNFSSFSGSLSGIIALNVGTDAAAASANIMSTQSFAGCATPWCILPIPLTTAALTQYVSQGQTCYMRLTTAGGTGTADFTFLGAQLG